MTDPTTNDFTEALALVIALRELKELRAELCELRNALAETHGWKEDHERS